MIKLRFVHYLYKSGAISAIYGYVSCAFPRQQLNLLIKTKMFTLILILNINIKVFQVKT